MNIWDELSKVDIEDKARFQELFSDVVSKIKNNEFELKIGEKEKEDYYMVIEENRMVGYFVHIVPKEVYWLFKKMQETNQFLGFSVVAGKYRNKDVRVSCFGVQCNLLGKSLIKK